MNPATSSKNHSNGKKGALFPRNERKKEVRERRGGGWWVVGLYSFKRT